MRASWWFLALTGLPLAVAAQTTPPAPLTAPAANVTAKGLASIVDALRKGDVPTLAKLYRHPPNPATRVLAAMALERIHFNLDKATEDARICEHALLESQPRIAFFCAEFANGDLRLAKGERAADADERDIVRRFAGKVPAKRLGGLRHYVVSRQHMPTLQVQRPAGTFVIPLGRKARTDMQTLTVRANGASLPLIVDTGSSNIVLDAKWAEKLGVRMTGRSDTTSGMLSRGIHVRRGMLDKLTFAGVTLEHVPVEVVPGKQRLIGIGILRHLDAFRLAKGKITVYGRNAALPACREPMLIASAPWGHGIRLLTAVRINDTLYTPLVDSGTSGFLYATQAASKKLKSGHNTRVILHGMGTHTHHTRTNWATAMVVISGQPFQVTLPVFKDANIPWDFMLGTGALDYMDFYFDFVHHHTCMLVHDNLP